MTNKNIDIETIQNQSAYGLSAELRKAVQDIKQAILRSQYEAARNANAELLSLYFGVGKYVSAHTRQGAWGTGAIERISERCNRNSLDSEDSQPQPYARCAFSTSNGNNSRIIHCR